MGDSGPRPILRCSPVQAGDRDSFDAVIAAPAFALGLRCSDEAVTGVSFLPAGLPERAASRSFACRAERQLRAYLHDPRSPFDLAVTAHGSPFRLRVWAAIAAIPLGVTRSYGELARSVGSVPRAVGQACGDNPIPIIVPCHRVVAAQGLGGFAHNRASYMLDVKRWLLEHERRAA